MSNAFPLDWPASYPRAKQRKQSPYKVSTEIALNDLLAGLRLMGAKHVVVSSNVPLRRDGTMYRGDHSDTRMPDPGVAVYWDTRDGLALAAAFDGWLTVRENLRAIGLTIEGLRSIERAGAIHLLERAYSGFKQLPSAVDCWTVLGIEPLAADGRKTPWSLIHMRYRELARDNHPDRGGSSETMARINDAYRDAMLTHSEVKA